MVSSSLCCTAAPIGLQLAVQARSQKRPLTLALVCLIATLVAVGAASPKPPPSPPNPPPSPKPPPPPPPSGCPSLPTTTATDPTGARAAILSTPLTVFSSLVVSFLTNAQNPVVYGLSGAQSSTSVNVPVILPFAVVGLTPLPSSNLDPSNVVRQFCTGQIVIYQAECTLADSIRLASTGVLATGSTAADQQCRDQNLGGATFNYWDKVATYKIVATLNLPSLTLHNIPGQNQQSFFIYTATGLNNTSFYNWRVQLIDIDGRSGYAPTCTTTVALRGCTTPNLPLRPLAVVLLPTIPTLKAGVISAPLNLTIVPLVGNRDWVNGELSITPTVTGGLAEFVPSSLTFKPPALGSTTPVTASFRILSFTVGATVSPPTVSYVVAATVIGSTTFTALFGKGYFDTINSVAINLIPDANGAAAAPSIITSCAVGYYPGDATSITSGNSTIITTSCTACPKYTTTYVDLPLSASDCLCDAGFLDVRKYLPSPYAIDETATTPCSTQNYYCSDGSSCVGYAVGAPQYVIANYWKYDFADWRLTVPSKAGAVASNGALLLSSTTSLVAAAGTSAWLCPSLLSGCGFNATGLVSVGCISGYVGVQCETCDFNYFYKGGICIPCSSTADLQKQISYVIILVICVVVGVAALFLGVLRPVQAIIALKVDGDPDVAEAAEARDDAEAAARSSQKPVSVPTLPANVTSVLNMPALSLRMSLPEHPAKVKEVAEVAVVPLPMATVEELLVTDSDQIALPAPRPPTPAERWVPSATESTDGVTTRGNAFQVLPFDGNARPVSPNSRPAVALKRDVTLAEAFSAGAEENDDSDSDGMESGNSLEARQADGAAESGRRRASEKFRRMKSQMVMYPRTDDVSGRVRALVPPENQGAGLNGAATTEARLAEEGDSAIAKQAQTLFESLRYIDAELLKARLPATFLPLPVIGFLVSFIEEAGDKIKIIFSLFQIMVLLPTIYILTWPTDFLGFTTFFDFISVNYIDVLPIDCISKHKWYNGMIIATAIPLGLVILAWIVAALFFLVFRKPKSRERILNRTIWASCFVMFIVFPSVSGKVLQFFNCEQLGDSFYVLRYNHNTQCYTGEYYTYMGYAIAMLIIFPAGIPIVFFSLLASQQRRGGLLTVNNRNRYGLLHNAYRLHFWWFEIAELFRKLFLSAIAVFIYPGSATQIMVSQFIAVAYSCIVLFLRPFKVRSDNWMAAMAHFEIFFLLSLAQMVRVSAYITDGYSITALAIVMVISVVLLPATAMAIVLIPVIAKRRMAVNAERREKCAGKGHVF